MRIKLGLLGGIKPLADVMARVKSEVANYGGVVAVDWELQLPIRWGGFEIPVRLGKCDPTSLIKRKDSIDRKTTARVIKKIAKRIVKDTDCETETVRINCAVVKHCSKSIGSGILIFWERK